MTKSLVDLTTTKFWQSIPELTDYHTGASTTVEARLRGTCVKRIPRFVCRNLLSHGVFWNFLQKIFATNCAVSVINFQVLSTLCDNRQVIKHFRGNAALRECSPLDNPGPGPGQLLDTTTWEEIVQVVQPLRSVQDVQSRRKAMPREPRCGGSTCGGSNVQR